MKKTEFDKEYDVQDPAEFLLKVLTYREYPQQHVDLKTIMLLGSMGSGKSTIIDYMINLLHSIYGNELNVISTNDPCFAIENTDLSFIQLLIVDDAITSGLDSRQSMSSVNINLTQNYSKARHMAKEKMGKGILFVIFSLQDPTRLDAFIRRNTQLTIIKTVYPNLDFRLKSKSKKFLEKITDKGMVFGDFAARAYALGRSQGNKQMRFFFPKEKPIINPKVVIDDRDLYCDVIEKLQLFFNLEDTKVKILKGFLEEYASKNDVEISPTVMTQIINRATYQQFKTNNSSVQETFVRNLRKKGASWQDIADRLGEPLGTIYHNWRHIKVK